MFIGVGLYADFALQIVFAIIGCYGWWKWIRGERGIEELRVRRATRGETVWLTVAGGLGTAAVALALATETDSQVPFWDSLVLSLSLVATYGQAKKILSSWYVWILVDLISVPLYFSKGLALTGLLYIGFTALCVYGLIRWVADLRTERSGAPDHPGRDPVTSLPRAGAAA
jgi:nicotinamide mononucleotide transporter